MIWTHLEGITRSLAWIANVRYFTAESLEATLRRIPRPNKESEKGGNGRFLSCMLPRESQNQSREPCTGSNNGKGTS